MKVHNKIKSIWIRFLIGIQRKARRKSLREAIEKAKAITAETGKKVLIYFIAGEYWAVTKQELKSMWREGKFPNLTLQQLEKLSEVKIESYERKTKGTTPGEKVIFAGN